MASLTTRIDKIIRQIRKVENSSFGSSKQSFDLAEYPSDYRMFLSKVGGVTIGEMCFSIYPSPINTKEIYGNDTHRDLRNITVIGDDFNGHCIGYDQCDHWKIFEIDKLTHELEFVSDSFIEFLEKDWRLNDLRALDDDKTKPWWKFW